MTVIFQMVLLYLISYQSVHSVCQKVRLHYYKDVNDVKRKGESDAIICLCSDFYFESIKLEHAFFVLLLFFYYFLNRFATTQLLQQIE